jgi:hypothetical protein
MGFAILQAGDSTQSDGDCPPEEVISEHMLRYDIDAKERGRDIAEAPTHE